MRKDQRYIYIYIHCLTYACNFTFYFNYLVGEAFVKIFALVSFLISMLSGFLPNNFMANNLSPIWLFSGDLAV